MNYLALRIWLIMTATFLISAGVARLAWQIPFTAAVPSLTMIILLILALLGIYALLIYLTIKFNLKKLTALPVRVGATIIFTAGLVGSSIHFMNLVLSPEATAALSVIIATLLLMSGVTAYLLILWLIWFIGKA